MRILTKVLIGVLSVATALPIGNAVAQNRATPANASVLARFKESGKISRVDPSTLTMVIEDGTFKMSGSLQVYTAAGQPTTVSALRKDMKIAFNMSWPDPKAVPVVTSILILSGP